MPLLLDLDVKDISGPLAQFQAKKVALFGLHVEEQRSGDLQAAVSSEAFTEPLDGAAPAEVAR